MRGLVYGSVRSRSARFELHRARRFARSFARSLASIRDSRPKLSAPPDTSITQERVSADDAPAISTGGCVASRRVASSLSRVNYAERVIRAGEKAEEFPAPSVLSARAWTRFRRSRVKLSEGIDIRRFR